MGYQIPFNGRVRAPHKDSNELCLFFIAVIHAAFVFFGVKMFF
jgi:hypothetical protein